MRGFNIFCFDGDSTYDLPPTNTLAGGGCGIGIVSYNDMFCYGDGTITGNGFGNGEGKGYGKETGNGYAGDNILMFHESFDA